MKQTHENAWVFELNFVLIALGNLMTCEKSKIAWWLMSNTWSQSIDPADRQPTARQ